MDIDVHYMAGANMIGNIRRCAFVMHYFCSGGRRRTRPSIVSTTRNWHDNREQGDANR